MKDPITLVRRKVVFEEIVIEREEFEKLNDEDVCELEMNKELGFDLDEIEHVAYEGDVTSYSDDCVTMFTQDSDWTWGKPDKYIQTTDVVSNVRAELQEWQVS